MERRRIKYAMAVKPYSTIHARLGGINYRDIRSEIGVGEFLYRGISGRKHGGWW